MRLDYSRRVLLYILSVKNQLYLSAQSERSNSVCAKRNIIGHSPHHCEAHHLYQRCNIVHLCPPCGGMMLSQGSNDVAYATQMMLCLMAQMKKSNS